MDIKNKGVGRIKKAFTWLFLGKRLLLSDDINLTCPRCSKRMDKVEKHGITIDVCPFCSGIWLDDGEIEKMVSLGNTSQEQPDEKSNDTDENKSENKKSNDSKSTKTKVKK